MSEREPSYGTVSQQLADAVQYSGGDNSDILKMLALTKEKPVTSWGDVNFSSEEILPQFRAARDGDSDKIQNLKSMLGVKWVGAIYLKCLGEN